MRKVREIATDKIAHVCSSGATMPTRAEISQAKRRLLRGDAEPVRLLRVRDCYVPYEADYAALSAALLLGQETIQAVVVDRLEGKPT